jgi:hypothetical protein
MVSTRIAVFRTPVVHEMTREEYWEQRRRVIASLVKSDARALPRVTGRARN